MKLLIMCEGPNELKIINILLENQKLKFSSDDLLGLVPYHARQIKSSAAVKAALNLYPDEVHVLRIGDGQNEKLEIPSAYRDKITLVEKYCTKPELEMLLIISENLADEYEKVKSKTKSKTFAKANIATVYKGNIIKNLIMDCQSYTKYRPNETTGGIFVSWRRKEELPTGA